MKSLLTLLGLRRPSALQLAVTQLESALQERLLQASLREYHSAMEDMLTYRIVRLHTEIFNLSQESFNAKQDTETKKDHGRCSPQPCVRAEDGYPAESRKGVQQG